MAGQIGSEPTWQEWLANLLDCTREWVRVLKPDGNLFVELGDKFSTASGPKTGAKSSGLRSGANGHPGGPKWPVVERGAAAASMREKCLLDLPHRYSIACVDQIGLIKRANIVWHHTNGLPESVTDRVRTAHTMVFHLVKQPRYYTAIDEIREASQIVFNAPQNGTAHHARAMAAAEGHHRYDTRTNNPLGKLPGSVWNIPSQPLQVPAHLGVDHFAAWPMEVPRRLVLGWSPPGICAGCGQGRRPVSERVTMRRHNNGHHGPTGLAPDNTHGKYATTLDIVPDYRITGYVCACSRLPDAQFNPVVPSGQAGQADGVTDVLPLSVDVVHDSDQRRTAGVCPPPTRPAIVLDPFGGTGTTALVASMHGRVGVSIDRSADYTRLAHWRTRDPGERAKALQVPKPPPVMDGQDSLFGNESLDKPNSAGRFSGSV